VWHEPASELVEPPALSLEKWPGAKGYLEKRALYGAGSFRGVWSHCFVVKPVRLSVGCMAVIWK